MFRIFGILGRILVFFRVCIEFLRIYLWSYMLFVVCIFFRFFDVGCLYKKRNWVIMNERCSWYSGEGGLGNSLRFRSFDLVGIGGGFEFSLVFGFGKIYDYKDEYFF